MTTRENIFGDSAPSFVLRAYWKLHQKGLASATEEQIRQQNSTIKLWSCKTQDEIERYITNDKETKEMLESLQILQAEQDPVLIIGPTGTGKEIIARALHGSRSGKFVAINCTSMPDELLESELFGHVKGAFTGALNDRIGKFRSAFAGTIFLDEIGDMPMSMQAKLLRVLQENVVTPVGSDNDEKINCRVVAATNRTLEQLSNVCHFRIDLFYRLAAFIVKTKGLIDRPNDVIDILDSLGAHELSTQYETWDLEAQQEFLNLISKGNVRSLQGVARRFLVLGKL